MSANDDSLTSYFPDLDTCLSLVRLRGPEPLNGVLVPSLQRHCVQLSSPATGTLGTFIHAPSSLLCPQRSDGPYALVLVPTREVSGRAGAGPGRVFSGTSC